MFTLFFSNPFVNYTLYVAVISFVYQFQKNSITNLSKQSTTNLIDSFNYGVVNIVT